MRRTFSKEFKRDAVVQSEREGASAVARQLGIGVNLIYRWRQALAEEGKDAFRGRGNHTEQEEEIWQLRQRVQELEEESEILKKASAYFAKHQRWGTHI